MNFAGVQIHSNPGFFTKTVNNIKLKPWNPGTLNKLKKKKKKVLISKLNYATTGIFAEEEKIKLLKKNLSSFILSMVPDSTSLYAFLFPFHVKTFLKKR